MPETSPIGRHSPPAGEEPYNGKSGPPPLTLQRPPLPSAAFGTPQWLVGYVGAAPFQPLEISQAKQKRPPVREPLRGVYIVLRSVRRLRQGRTGGQDQEVRSSQRTAIVRKLNTSYCFINMWRGMAYTTPPLLPNY